MTEKLWLKSEMMKQLKKEPSNENKTDLWDQIICVFFFPGQLQGFSKKENIFQNIVTLTVHNISAAGSVVLSFCLQTPWYVST